MCLVGSNASMFWTVNSPTLETHQKQMVMHAKVAASRGSFKSSCDLKSAMMARMKGGAEVV